MRPEHKTIQVAIAIAFLAIPLHAQFGESVDVRVIQVPVTVWRGDEPVEGLTKDDFELFVNGARHPIDYFDVIDFASSAPDVQQSEPERSQPVVRDLQRRRLTVLLFDLASSEPHHLKRVRNPVEELVTSAPPDDFFAVATYDGSAIRYLTPFTADRMVTLRAIGTLRRSRAGDPLALALTANERMSLGGSFQVPDPTLNAGESVDSIGDSEEIHDQFRRRTLAPDERLQKFLEEKAADRTAKSLSALAGDVAALEGIKQVLLFTTGAAMGRSQAHARNEVHDSFRRAGTVLHVIDLMGLVAPGSADTKQVRANYRTPGALFEFAVGTGGRVLHGTGVENAVRIFSETRRVTYVLGFRPPRRERAKNEIVVKLKNQRWGAHLSYRSGYSVEAARSRDINAVVLADVLLNDIPHTDVTVNIDADEHGTVDVGVPSDEILAHAIDGAVTMTVYVYVFDAAGNVVGWKERTMLLDEAKTRDALQGAELVRRERFSLPPGSYVAKAVVHVPTGNLLSFKRTEFEIH